MTTPSELVVDTWGQVQTWSNDAKAEAEVFLTKLGEELYTAPTIDMTWTAIDAPTALVIPDAPTINLHSDFLSNLEEVPTLSLAAPTAYSHSLGSKYTSGLLTELGTVVDNRLDGGTGLDTTVETAIWDRARDREAAAAQGNVDEVTRTAQALGFALPTGALAAQLRQAQQNVYEKSSELSRDIAIKQAELEQTNLLQAVNQGIELESRLITQALETEKLGIENAKAVSDSAVQVYGAQVEKFKADVAGYGAYAAAYDALMKGELANVEVFKAEIAGVEAQVNQDMKRWEIGIKQYEAQANYTLAGEKMNTEVIQANRQSRLDAAKTGAQIWAQIQAASHAIFRASAGVSASGNMSVQYSYNNQTSSSPASVTAV